MAMAQTLLRSLGRQCLLRNQSVFLQKSLPSSSSAYTEMKEFWSKNRRLERPLSPHLSIYAKELTSGLSLIHRATGIAMAVGVTTISITLFALPGEFPTYIDFVKSLAVPAPIIIAAKYGLCFPVTYHYINGIRHLCWDWAMGFELGRVYKTGYFVVSLVACVCTGFVFGC
ncbi:hypothetical protein ScPMuIL_002901 [Solemya velum]